MNVLFLTSSLPRFKNDSQIPFVYEQARAWKEKRSDDTIIILAPHDIAAKREETDPVGINIRRFVYWWPQKWQSLAYPALLPNIRNKPYLIFQLPFYFLSKFFCAKRLIKDYQIDLVYAHWVMPHGIIAWFLKLFTKTPYILQNHSSDIRIFGKIPLVGKSMARKIIGRSEILFCVNSKLRKEALSLFTNDRQEILGEKIYVLPMGAYLKSFLSNTGQITDRDDYRYNFALIGRLTRKKGGDHLIRALLELEKRNVAYCAAIAGDGEEKKHLQSLTTSPSIDFVGFVTGEKKAEFFRKTKVFLFPSIEVKGDIEGLPVAIMEALNAGKIIVASKDTNIELLPEWEKIRDVVYMLEDPRSVKKFADLLERLLREDPEISQEQMKNIKETIERYQWSNLIKEYLSVIDKTSINRP